MIPRSPSPTTETPITAPLLKDTLRAAFKPVIALTVVLVFALTAMYIPINPARAEPIAPPRYANAVEGTLLDGPSILSSTSQSMNTARMTQTTTTKIASNVYSRRRNAIAPSLMASPIACIASLPSSSRTILTASKKANASAVAPAAIAM